MTRTPDGPPDPAHSWVEHLRAGGTTPWLTWLQQPNREKVAAEQGEVPARAGRKSGPERYGVLPGAAQLELVRRLAERYDARSGPRDFTRLADRALTRVGPGRGRHDLPLLRPGEPAPGVGAPPTDPALLHPDELIRPGVGLLVDLLLDDPRVNTDVATGPPDPRSQRPPAGSPARRNVGRPWRRRFHLAGAPATTARVRAALASAGHVEGGRRPEVVILAEPLDVHLAQVWSQRVRHGAPVRWRPFVARWAHPDRLPPSAELTTIAAFWAERVGPERVHVVAGADPRRATAAALRLPDPPPADSDVPALSPAAVDLQRRLNSVLNVRVDEVTREHARARAVTLLRGLDAATRRDIAVPARHRGWLDARADALADGIRRGGYPVHGDLDAIAPRHRGRSHPYRPDVLALVLDSCLAVAGLRRGRE